MSGDQLSISFGDSTAQPSTPKQTPTSSISIFPSPVFESQKPGLSALSTTASTTPGPDWTPRFAENFSVFHNNNTPGNFRGSHGPFGDFVAPFTTTSPPPVPDSANLAYSPSAYNHKQLLSVDSVAADVAFHANRPSTSSSSLSLPPVDPSSALSSSPGSLAAAASAAAAAAAFSSTPVQDTDTTTSNQGQSPDCSYYGSVSSNADSPRAIKAAKKARGDSVASPSKASRGFCEFEPSYQGQTATPPPSARKVPRRLAPKLRTTSPSSPNMQSEQGYGPQHQQHPDFFDTPQQQPMTAFSTSPADLFGNYPMSAPATATAFADARTFWPGADPNMMVMDMDFGANMFATPNTVQRQLDAIDWTQASQATQSYMLGTNAQPHMDHHHHQHHHHHHMQQMAMTAESDSKQLMPTALTLDTVSASHHASYSGAYATPVDDPYGMVNPNGGVNPGLLFSRPPSSSMDAMASAPAGAASALSLADAATFEQQQQQLMTRSSPPQHMSSLAPGDARVDLRRSNSVRDLAPRRKASDRTLTNSPSKSGAAPRPGLSRSQSENRGPPLRGRASLPTLAPAVKAPALTTSQTAASLCTATSNALGISRSASFGGSRPTGRNSPIRMQQHQRQQQQLHQQQQLQQLHQQQQHQQHQQHQQQQQMDQHSRLSSLTSIPEVNTPKAKASVKFTIDATGRARVETGPDDDDDDDEPTPRTAIRRNQSARNLHNKSKWDSSTEEDSSSSDDELIVIPSRTTSFALPDPVKPTIGRAPLHASQRSVSDRSTSSTGTGAGTGTCLPGDTLFHEIESEAETVLTDVPKGAGDAASELEKLRQMRPKRVPPAGVNTMTGGGNLFGTVRRSLQFGGPLGGNPGGGGSRGMQAVSPTTRTEASLPTPSTGSRSHGIRCICGRSEAPPASDGFIVQCESCDMWLHGRCINITKRTLPPIYICAFCAQTPTAHGVRMPASGAGVPSPLAHKSFKTFR